MRKSALVVLLTGLVLLVVGPLAIVESVATQRAQNQTLQNDAAQIAAGFTAQFERARSLNLCSGRTRRSTVPGRRHRARRQCAGERCAGAPRRPLPGSDRAACLIDD